MRTRDCISHSQPISERRLACKYNPPQVCHYSSGGFCFTLLRCGQRCGWMIDRSSHSLSDNVCYGQSMQECQRVISNTVRLVSHWRLGMNTFRLDFDPALARPRQNNRNAWRKMEKDFVSFCFSPECRAISEHICLNVRFWNLFPANEIYCNKILKPSGSVAKGITTGTSSLAIAIPFSWHGAAWFCSVETWDGHGWSLFDLLWLFEQWITWKCQNADRSTPRLHDQE